MAARVGSFKARLLWLSIGGLVLLQAATLTAVHVAGERTLEGMVAEELRVGARVFERVLRSRGRQMSDSARVLVADFAFREAVATADGPTIASALRNHGGRIGADAVFLVSLDGTVAVDTLSPAQAPRPFPHPQLLERALARGESAAIVTFEGLPYQFVVVPVLAPDPIALVCVGFPLGEETLSEVGRLTSLEVSLVGGSDSEPFLVSTLPAPEREQLRSEIRADPAAGGAARSELALGLESYESLSQAVETAQGSGIRMLLHSSMALSREPFRRLELQIFTLSSLALLLAGGVAVVLAQGVSQPLLQLAEAARRVGMGDYSTPLRIERADEIGVLATAFDAMRTGIGEREEQIRYQATHDALTGLPNRTLFLDRLAHAIEVARRRGGLVGLLMMDLDRFKEINETIGHHFGDELLVEVGRRLRKTTREADSVARLGGDEFAVSFETADPTHALEIAHRTGRALDAPFLLAGVPVAVKASIGVALHPIHAEDPGTLMKRADVAMYDAKQSQRSVALYEPVRDEHSLRRLTILADLRHAVASDQLEVHYQPKVRLHSARLEGVEALVRWRHPTHGLLPPDEFIPLAEQSGDIGLLTRWILRRAIRDCAEWRQSGRELSVAVNLSALDLHDAELPALIDGLLHERGLPASNLVVEITENVVMREPSQAALVLGELKSRGVVVAIDDFGTGYSSLAMLKRLPVDLLKIDKSFVINLSPESAEDGVIVRSTIDLGHNMGLEVVAEGVSSAESWGLLKSYGCDLAQGFFVSQPLARSALEAWVSESRWAASP